MNRFAFISFWRSLTRHKLYAALNIGGLALGIAVFLVLALYVRFDTGFEKWIPDYKQVAILENTSKDDFASYRARQSTPIAAWTAIHADLPDVVGTRLDGKSAAVVRNGVGTSERLVRVDPDFFRVLPLSVVAGAAPDRFTDPTALVITQRTATKYFGTANPIGAPLSVIFDGVRHAYRVVAVVADLPDATQLDFDLMAPLVLSSAKTDPRYANDHYWNYGGPTTLLRFPDEAARRRFDAALPALAARHVVSETPNTTTPYQLDLFTRPFASAHFELPGTSLMATTLGLIGMLTLIVAVVNYVNLATARAGLRAREVGMRKVLGADRGMLRRHYIGEAVVTAVIAAVIGLALAELGVPLVNAATGLKLAIHYGGWDGVLLPLAALAVGVGVAAGLYPAAILSRVPAAAVLAATRSPGGGRAGSRIREALVVFQFAITIALITGTLVLVAQTRHVRTAPVGYDRDQLLLVRSFGSANLDEAQRTEILHRTAALPGVTAVSAGTSVPGIGLYTSSTNLKLPGIAGNGPPIEQYQALPGFFGVLGAHLIAGRLFEPGRAADVDPNAAHPEANFKLPANIVINRTAVQALHFASPEVAIGKTVGGETPRTIIGVIDDMRVGSARNPVSPTLYTFLLQPDQAGVMAVRYTGDAKAMLAAVEGTWRAAAPEVPFIGLTAVQALAKLSKPDDQMANLFAIGAILAVAIGCVGLWGLASFTTARRVKEIGIRKTLGASSTDIVRLLVGQFLRPVLVANLFAWPLAWVAMRTWLAGFDDRIALSPLFFVGASVLALVIALVTVLAQSLRASRATPAWALRHE